LHERKTHTLDHAARVFKGWLPLWGEVTIKMVDKILRGGNHVAVLRVRMGVYQKCGERLCDQDTFEQFERTREDLRAGRVQDLRRIGNTYEKVTAT